MIRYIKMRVIGKELREQVEDWCKKKKVPYHSRESMEFSSGTSFYFSIRGDTDTYNKIKQDIPSVILTHDSDLFNILDCDDETIGEFHGILNSYEEAIVKMHKADSWFLDFIMKLDSVDKLVALKNYSAHFGDFGNKLLDTRIKCLKGEPRDYELWLQEQIEKQERNLHINEC
ncbi:hypothetical protein [Lacrimispora amygdalina]|uniref:hypothetical protein n=1 Tax=Lacrimispora amygdalina TaxID=253257 RepID=UPI000BE22C72|nr:hypothetical protein [Lacrimispora amygdalina]